MADTKISALPAASAANLTDLLAKVNDPSGTPATQRVTLQQIKDLLQPYKVYRALLTQLDTNAPAAVVLENTLGGTVVWTREDIGIYTGTLAGAFPEDKVLTFASTTPTYPFSIISIARGEDSSTISIHTALLAGSADLADGQLYDASIQILVYP